MKRLRSKYTTILIVLSLVLSAGLQAVWLRQLFSAQQKQLKDDIEHFVSTTAQAQMYRSVTSFEKPKNLPRVKQLFLSPQWAQLRQAFDNMKALGISYNFQINSDDDSTSVSMNFSLKDKPAKERNRGPATTNTGLTAAQLSMVDSLSLIAMKKEVAAGLQQMGITSAIYYNLYNYSMTGLRGGDVPKGLAAAYASKKYLYGIQEHYRYQLILSAINNVVWYRMRYYVASCLLMLLLTCAAFYFIMRLLRNVRLYADAKADFTRNMTHEFKTPIATVSLALESIQKYNLAEQPETMQNYLDISRHELQRLDLMVEKALNIGNEKDAEIPFNTELYDVQTGLQQVITSMQLQLLNSGSEIVFKPSAEPCFVFGDPVHLTNIFYNLVENAIKYSGTGLVLDISCACDDKTVTISFKDNGPGIDKIYHKNIFDKFYRIPADGNTHDIKGTGLGLYYVKQMVERHNGTIKVKSETGNGTCFIITLPAAS
ncbi:HAMP domain-containing sensor histidine kinase [Mucilaginibacter sp.]|uniref:sensor histidine kinase n=1 Tax=Mucilaginibacter sp. TaxID=1882438 RepID=UPI0025EDB5A5|nr:HAMP domain-containing sensor histidine kinase [Mucilaginibacter sp.]